MYDIYDITPEEEEDIKFQEKCEAQKLEASRESELKENMKKFKVEFSGFAYVEGVDQSEAEFNFEMGDTIYEEHTSNYKEVEEFVVNFGEL